MLQDARPRRHARAARIVGATTKGRAGMNAFDAAYQVLGEAGEPLHYREITKRMITSGLWTEYGSGRTPEATVNATISRDIRNNGAASRFRRIGRGVFEINATAGAPVQQTPEMAAQIKRHNERMCQRLLKRAREGSPAAFESLVRTLLEQMGFHEVRITSLSGDGGVDVRGTLVVAEAIHVRMAVQAKRWRGRNVGRPVVQQLRGSLGAHEQGLIITTSDFTAGAKEEAERPDASPVSLMNGRLLSEQLAKHEVGVRHISYALFTPEDGEEDSAA